MARKYREIGKAGWGYTVLTGLVGLIYFAPVLWIILTAFKTRTDALAVPPKIFFTPTLENFTSVFYRSSITTGTSQSTDMALYFFNSIFIAGTSVGLALIVGDACGVRIQPVPAARQRYIPVHHSDDTHDAADCRYHSDIPDVSPVRSGGQLLGYHSALHGVQYSILGMAGEKLFR